jgi:hypothetical protein
VRSQRVAQHRSVLSKGKADISIIEANDDLADGTMTRMLKPDNVSIKSELFREWAYSHIIEPVKKVSDLRNSIQKGV